MNCSSPFKGQLLALLIFFCLVFVLYFVNLCFFPSICFVFCLLFFFLVSWDRCLTDFGSFVFSSLCMWGSSWPCKCTFSCIPQVLKARFSFSLVWKHVLMFIVVSFLLIKFLKNYVTWLPNVCGDSLVSFLLVSTFLAWRSLSWSFGAAIIRCID